MQSLTVALSPPDHADPMTWHDLPCGLLPLPQICPPHPGLLVWCSHLWIFLILCSQVMCLLLRAAIPGHPVAKQHHTYPPPCSILFWIILPFACTWLVHPYSTSSALLTITISAPRVTPRHSGILFNICWINEVICKKVHIEVMFSVIH